LSSIRTACARVWSAARTRLARAALAAAAATLGAAALAAPAGAGLSAVGPVNPATGFPDWYQDSTGLKLQPCLDGPPFCLASRSDLAAPDGEAFWWQAEATLPIGAGSARLVLAQEAAFLDGARVAFARVRVTVTSARADTKYTFTHPYGTVEVTTDGNGNGRFTHDVGCGAAPCAWATALGGDIGPQFLRWNPAVAPAAPAGFAGDAITPHVVTGGSVRNTFGVSGGGISALTELFTVQGKLAGPPVPVYNGPTAMGFGTTAPGVPVVKTVPITSFGVPDAAGRSSLTLGQIAVTGPNAGEFLVVGNTCTAGRSLPSGTACAVTIRFMPGGAGAKSAVLSIPHNAVGGRTQVALSGAGAVPAAPGAGAAGASAAARALAIARLRTTHRLSRARVLRRGLRLTMRLPAGTEIVRIAIYRVRHGKVRHRPVWLGYRVVGRTGLYRLRLDSRALRRRLKAGLYQVNVTPGLSRHQLGRTATTRIRITRR
jgi:hypothetical protein